MRDYVYAQKVEIMDHLHQLMGAVNMSTRLANF